MTKAAYDRVKRNFSLEAMARQHIKYSRTSCETQTNDASITYRPIHVRLRYPRSDTEVASQTDQVSRVVCLRDEANCLQEVRPGLGLRSPYWLPVSRSTWARALQLFQLVRQSGKRDQSLICWNRRYDVSSVPLLRIFKQWRTVITTPSKRELAYPGFVGTQILKGSTQIYVSSKYLQSQFPNSQLALPWLNNSREPSHQAELPKKGSIDLKEHFGLSPSSKVIDVSGTKRLLCRLKEAIWIIGILEHLHSDVHLVICGVGPQTDRLRMVADQMVLRPRIHFLSLATNQ